MNKKVLIIASDGFEDVEMVATRDILIRNGFDVDVAFKSNGNLFATSSYNLKIKIELTFEKVLNKLNDYVALFIPGGPGVENIDLAKETDEIIKHFINEDKFIGAICAAPTILAKRGYLKDKKAICYPDSKLQKILIKNGSNLVSTKCNFSEECAIVRDGKIMTGLDMKTSIRFGEEFSKFISK